MVKRKYISIAANNLVKNPDFIALIKPSKERTALINAVKEYNHAILKVENCLAAALGFDIEEDK